MGHFWVSQFPLYLKDGGDLSRQTSQYFFFLLPWTHVKRSASQNKRLAVLQIAFRARKVIGTFEKQAPGSLACFQDNKNKNDTEVCWHEISPFSKMHNYYYYYYDTRKRPLLREVFPSPEKKHNRKNKKTKNTNQPTTWHELSRFDFYSMSQRDHFTVLCLVTRPLNKSEDGVDLVLIQIPLLFLCK